MARYLTQVSGTAYRKEHKFSFCGVVLLGRIQIMQQRQVLNACKISTEPQNCFFSQIPQVGALARILSIS